MMVMAIAFNCFSKTIDFGDDTVSTIRNRATDSIISIIKTKLPDGTFNLKFLLKDNFDNEEILNDINLESVDLGEVFKNGGLDIDTFKGFKKFKTETNKMFKKLGEKTGDYFEGCQERESGFGNYICYLGGTVIAPGLTGGYTAAGVATFVASLLASVVDSAGWVTGGIFNGERISFRKLKRAILKRKLLVTSNNNFSRILDLVRDL